LKNKLFIEGDIGIGKSTIIREAVLPYIKEVGGFFTLKIFYGHKKKGFAIRPIKEAEDYVLSIQEGRASQIPDVFMFEQNGSWIFKQDIFIKKAIQYISEANDKKLIVLDEIGGLELKDPVFMETIKKVLNSNMPILGVLKSRKNLSKLNLVSKLNTEGCIFNLQEICELIEIITITGDNRESIKETINQFVCKAIGVEKSEG
jgi:nucleoside-triphosphatase